MKINFLEDINPKLPKGGNLTIEPNKTNLVVGRNGSGKTITFSSLVTHLVKHQTKQKDHNWMVEPRADIQKKFSFEGFESVNQVVHYTAKIRQSHWVDLDMALSHPYGHMVLNRLKSFKTKFFLDVCSWFNHPVVIFLFSLVFYPNHSCQQLG
jgi:ABC-type dipeptide/oligopeptide/nickel transport system ATPase component